MMRNGHIEKILVARLIKLTNDDKLVWEVDSLDTSCLESRSRNWELRCELWREGTLNLVIKRRRPYVLYPDGAVFNEDQCSLWELAWAIERQHERRGKSMVDYEFRKNMIMGDCGIKQKRRYCMLVDLCGSLDKV